MADTRKFIERLSVYAKENKMKNWKLRGKLD